jgi:hypothetical protein
MAIYFHPPQPFVGGHQPLGPGKAPLDATAVPENDPPFGGKNLLWAVLVAWQTVAPTAQFRPGVPQEAVAAEAPVLSSRPWLPTVLGSWEGEPPIVTTQRVVPQGQPEDNPPFGVRQWLPGVLAAWQAPPSPPSARSVAPPAEAVTDNPPFGLRPWVATVIEAWKPTVPLTPPRLLPQEFVAAPVDDPPFGQRLWLPAVVESWRLGPLPTLPRQSATVVGVGLTFTTFGPIVRSIASPGVNVYVALEVTIKTSNPALVAQARLFNITDATVVAGSTISTDSTTATRVRSATLTLAAAAKEYRVEFGGVGGATYTIHSADLIFGG